MKKKTLILFISIISLLFISVFFYGTSIPDYGDTHSEAGCHENTAGYAISTNITSPISANRSSIIYFNISASGLNLFIQAYPGAEDNDLFTISNTSRIKDGDPDDNDPSSDILVTFNITAPSSDGYYVIFILAGDSTTDPSDPPPFAFLEIEVSVGGAAQPGFDLSKIFDHLGLYLGLPALILVSLGTVLVLINENKFVKLHGILAGGSWILTVINLSAAIIKMPINTWFGVYPLIYHIPHIILGMGGLIAGFLSMLFGIAAERKPAKLTGYITLVCWWAAFFLGYFLNSNLLLL